MKTRYLLGLTAVTATIVGAAVVYLVLTVPNDLKADSLLMDARKSLTAGKTNEAQTALSQIVERHPRTDAAAAATVALARIADQERAKLQTQITQLRRSNDNQTKVLNDLRQSIETIKNAPPPKPVVIQSQPPKPIVVIRAPAPVKKPAMKRPTPKRRAPTRTRRRG